MGIQLAWADGFGLHVFAIAKIADYLICRLYSLAWNLKYGNSLLPTN